MIFADGPSAPPPAGVASSGGSTNYLNGASASTGIPLNGGVSSSGNQEPYIYQGTHKVTKNTNANVAEQDALYGSTLGAKLSDLQRKFINSDANNKRHWAYLMALTGYAGQGNLDPQSAADFAKTADLQTVLDLHNKFLTDAATQFNIYGRKVTPQQLMRQMLDYRLGDAWDGNLKSLSPDTAGKLGSGGTTTKTTSSRSVDLMSNEDAKGMVRTMLQQELGRDPTQAEYEDFVATLHSAERGNPTKNSTTTTYDSQGNAVSSSSKTSGGLGQGGANQALYEKLRQSPTWGEWQAVGTYAPALFEALGAAVPGV